MLAALWQPAPYPLTDRVIHEFSRTVEELRNLVNGRPPVPDELEVITADGRSLRVALWGPPDGIPVASLHGTPGSRLNRYADPQALTELGVRLVTYDRPGYGDSTPQPGRDVAGAAADVRAVAGALGFDRLPVFGYSGGSPHALACAALLPDLVPRAASVAGIAPYDAPGLDWLAGQMPGNVEEFRAALAGRDRLEALIGPWATAIAADPARILDDDSVPPVDREALSRPELRAMMADAMALGMGSGPAGWADDDLAFVRPWGFDPAAITGPVAIWHGAQDVYAPPGHSTWLAAAIPDAEYHYQEADGHLSLQRHIPDILRWLLR